MVNWYSRKNRRTSDEPGVQVVASGASDLNAAVLARTGCQYHVIHESRALVRNVLVERIPDQPLHRESKSRLVGLKTPTRQGRVV